MGVVNPGGAAGQVGSASTTKNPRAAGSTISALPPPPPPTLEQRFSIPVPYVLPATPMNFGEVKLVNRGVKY